jgi:hypothetical protein
MHGLVGVCIRTATFFLLHVWRIKHQSTIMENLQGGSRGNKKISFFCHRIFLPQKKNRAKNGN